MLNANERFDEGFESLVEADGWEQCLSVPDRNMRHGMALKP